MKSKKWRKWLELIYWDISYLRRTRLIYLEMARLYNLNIDAFSHSFFRRWLELSYATCASLSIRRLVDQRKNTGSLVKLLQDIKNYNACITRKNFVAMMIESITDESHFHGHKGYLIEFKRRHERNANRIFTKWVGSGGYLHRAEIQTDINFLVAISKPIKNFTDEFCKRTGIKAKYCNIRSILALD